IRYYKVTGVQTCALPISGGVAANGSGNRHQGKREKEEVVANELAHSFGPVHSCGSAFSFAVSPRAGPPALWRRRAIPGRIGPTPGLFVPHSTARNFTRGPYRMVTFSD